jgi:hypothetical protein
MTPRPSAHFCVGEIDRDQTDQPRTGQHGAKIDAWMCAAAIRMNVAGLARLVPRIGVDFSTDWAYPETRRPITGTSIHDWKNLTAPVANPASALSGGRTQSWDVVLIDAGPNEHEIWAFSAGGDRRHGGVHTELPRLIARRRDHAALARSADRHGRPRRLGSSRCSTDA